MGGIRRGGSKRLTPATWRQTLLEARNDEAVDELEVAEQPLTGFDYSYWFECAPAIGDLVHGRPVFTATRPATMLATLAVA
jgi:hypothetical protein